MSRFRVVELFCRLFDEATAVVKLAEEVGSKLMVYCGGGTAIDVEGDAETFERVFYQIVIAVNHLLDSYTFFTCADSNRHAVFVATAYKQHVLAFQTKVTDVDVCRDIDAGKVTYVNRTVGVGKGRCYKCSFIHIFIVLIFISFISPLCAMDTFPVSSDTTMARASVFSAMPSAARWRRP